MRRWLSIFTVAIGLIHSQDAATASTALEKLDGQAVDLAPWAYEWRADREVQDKPEAYFIPRRLERIDKVYRTARAALPADQLKSIYYDMPDVLRELPPAPKGKLRAGLLWVGGVSRYRVELEWPEGAATPNLDAIEVRTYPTSFGWFGWTVDKVMRRSEVSADGRKWTYVSDPSEKMDTAYSQHIEAATEMIAVFGATDLVPKIAITGESIGTWKRIDLEIQADHEPKLEPYMAILGNRQGRVVPLLYAPGARAGLDSRLTIGSGDNAFTIRVADVEKGPVRFGDVVITKAGSAKAAATSGKSIRQMTREHREAASWDELMREVRLWTCPPATKLTMPPAVDDPPMRVELSDEGWTRAWRAASAQLKGKHMWGGLAFEVGRVAREMELVGLHDEAAKVYEHFLSHPGAKSDGDYSDGNGALEHATSLRHDMGYSHDGTHASTGRLLFAMAERFFLTGDRAWFEKHRARLQTAADWIVRQRAGYMKDVSNRRELFVAGLMPPQMLGDYALPACDWRWYYCDNAFALQGLSRFADALAEVDPAAAKPYRDEASAFRDDLRRTALRDAALAPIRLGRDGAYHSYIPRMAYARGLTGPEIGAPQFPDCDRFMGALPLAEPLVAIDAGDSVMMDTLDVMEEMGTSPAAIAEQEAARKAKGIDPSDAWFWMCYTRLPKASHNANIYLLQDDVPSFLRFWSNAYASVVGANGKFWEHWSHGNFDDCTHPDNGTAGWFLENFRNLLVMEDGHNLWLARATPRAWLEQGKKISVKNAPTYFGTMAYEIVSDVDHGAIRATLNVPSRTVPQALLLRLRHPRAARMKSVRVNGEPWGHFDAEKEIVYLTGAAGAVTVEVEY